MKRPLSFLFAFYLPTLARAEATVPGVAASSYLQATLALLLIVGLLFGAAWLARKVSGGKIFGQGNLKVIGGVALGPRERLVLVEVEDTWLVIGIVPGQIRTLHRLPKGQMENSATKIGDAPFAQWLQSIKERRNDAG